jgi:DNA-binding transcriptional MerR regulator
MTTGLLTIGRFARLVRLSAKQLRRYDELGLLAPARVDPDTGYRFYHPRQACTAATIALFRELDVPLSVIRDLLVADDDRIAALLEAERARRAAQLDRLARDLAALTRLAADGTLPVTSIEIRHEPARRLATVHASCEVERMTAVTSDLAARLARVVPDPSVAFTALFPIDLPATLDIVIGAELPETPTGTVPIDLPAGPVAAAVHDGPVETIALSWWPLLAWVHERGLEPAGPVRERYLDDRTTHLIVPLHKEPTT